MRSFSPTRGSGLTLGFGLAFVVAAMTAMTPLSAHSQRQQNREHRSIHSTLPMGHERQPAREGAGAMRQNPADPMDRRTPHAQALYPAPPGAQMHSQPAHNHRGVHLGQWMSEHGNLTPQQQSQALEREPGFRSLSPKQQDHMRTRLSQLDAMPPDRRQREIAHIEMMERLEPGQRRQVRGAMQQLGSLPPDQRHAVARIFREIRRIPPAERPSVMNSYRYNWLNPAQRSALNNLLIVAPLLPPPGR